MPSSVVSKNITKGRNKRRKNAEKKLKCKYGAFSLSPPVCILYSLLSLTETETWTPAGAPTSRNSFTPVSQHT